MDTDELKAAWQALDRRLAQHDRVNMELYRDSKIEKARSSLRPLFWGQLAQLLFGLCFVVLASLVWIRGGDLPSNVLLAAVFVHAYGVAVAAVSGMTMGLVGSVDYGAPVLAIQQQLGKLRRMYIISSMVAGLPWWLLWFAVLMVLAGLGGMDVYARTPSVIWLGLGIGIPGLLATWWWHRWSRSGRRPKLARAMEDGLTGNSLRRAQAQLEEVARFEQE